ncbi:MAG: GGDEF domain-containing protein [Treponema sp.]|jgi:diguanylate cyclase (GGDEF)-like protein|nr:GGDEF domain-containing protein [Treponema sp.]
MDKFLYSWRYYSFGRDQYNDCINRVFVNNLYSLRQANFIFAVFVGFFSILHLVVDRNFINAGIHLASCLIASMLALYANYKLQTALVNNRFIIIFTTVFYVNVMAFGIVLGIWLTPDRLPVVFLCFLICALLMFINSPFFNLLLTVCTMGVFITLTILFKSSARIIYDIADVFVVGIFSLYFNWHISKLRMGMEISTNVLEDERNKYFNQSTIDELTKLNNRRDFFQTFERYLSKYRTSDDLLCISISDIDFFKNYNDHYGHPMGDECLRSVGMAFNKLKETLGVYVARVGGEEFAMLWFEKDISHVNVIISAVNKLIKEMKIPHEKSNVSDNVTMSMGVYVERLVEHADVETLYDLADKALYAAKSSGRNCAIISGKDIAQFRIPPVS